MISSLYYGFEDEMKENYLSMKGGTMTGVLDMKLNALKNIPAPIGNTDAICKVYLEVYIESFVENCLIETLITGLPLCLKQSGSDIVRADKLNKQKPIN